VHVSAEGRRPFWARQRKIRNPYVLDGLIAASIGLVSLIAFVTIEPEDAGTREADAFGIALVVLANGSLAFRRRWPLAVYLLATTATVVGYLADYPEAGLPFTALIAVYTLASQATDRRVTVLATAPLFVIIPVMFAAANRGDFEIGTLVGNLTTFTLAAIWGDRKKVREAYFEQLELRAAEKERERYEAAERAAADERLRIARELHDVVAHAMSVVAVQSGVGAHVIDTRPDEAKRILETISATSRDSLNEMRRLLGVLRSDDTDGADATELAPAPGLDGLDELVRRVTDAGVPVDVTVDGRRPDTMSAGVDLAAYRIVQEALTNVLKHAGANTRATVRVAYEPVQLRIAIADDGRGAASSVNGQPGHGIVGMRERAALYGGTLDAGPKPGGGYEVTAMLRYETRP
jgi:signal transduction histidine kinase